MTYWGVAIPGLAMTAAELPEIDGLLRLENPEIGLGPQLSRPYSLRDVAALHAETIAEHFGNADSLTVIGMSMGSMIAAILASDLRDKLPRETKFRFLVASANSSDCPAVPDSLLEAWKRAKPGELEIFGELLAPFFSPQFLRDHLDRFEEYVTYRASGRNRQSAKAFQRQTAALRSFRGEEYFSRVIPEEALFIGAEADSIFGPAHSAELRKLNPKATHRELPFAGHMLNIEVPKLWNEVLPS